MEKDCRSCKHYEYTDNKCLLEDGYACGLTSKLWEPITTPNTIEDRKEPLTYPVEERTQWGGGALDPAAGTTRQFTTGATRDTDEGKHDYEGFLSPLVLERFGEYMTLHRKQSDGNLRDSDNWQKGIPKDAYIKSAWRHFMDWWKEHRGHSTEEGLEAALCALLFNVMGYLHETMKEG